MEQEEAIEAFMLHMAYRGYRDPIKSINSWLIKGPVGKKPSPGDVEVHRWYKELDEESQLMIERIIHKTAFATLFGILVRLDNLSGGYPVEGKLSDFALYIQSYPDQAAHSRNQPDMAIRLNSPNNSVDMHDLIQQYIDKLTNSEKSGTS